MAEICRGRGGRAEPHRGGHTRSGSEHRGNQFVEFDSLTPVTGSAVNAVNDRGISVSTGNFEASSTGDAEINDTVALPANCSKPIVFVAAPTGQWFAESNPDD